jgi:ssDNA-binding Zn-finger/Zn-ribbon topoisomerase 1
MLRTRLVQATGGRNSVDSRIRAAAHLLLAALADLGAVMVEDVACELERRELVLLVRSVESIVDDLTARLISLDAGELIGAQACPHCGWSRAPVDGRCPRCSKIREVPRERRGEKRIVLALAERRARRDRR